MATYSNIGIKLITTGDESGTWGTSTNTNFSDVLDEAIAGAVTYNISSDADFTLTVSDGTSSDARHAVIKFTSTTLTATRTCTFAPNDLQKTWVVINATTGGQSLTFKQGSAGATVTVPNGESAIIYSDGGGASAGAITRVLDSFTNTKITTGTLNATTLDLTNLEVTNIKAKDGTAAASIADSTGIVSLSANPILSGGTANGVLYLDGSKVATSGSAVTYNGTTFATTGAANFATSSGNVGIGTASPTHRLTIGSGSYTQAAASSTTGMYTTATGLEMLSDSYYFGNRSGTNLAFLNSSGNLGLGVTPSAWSTYKAVQVGWSALAGYAGVDTALFSNAFFESGAWKYVGNGKASQYRQLAGVHSWQIADTGTAGNAITFTQAMTLDANGDLGIGTTSIPSGGASTRNVSIHNSNSAGTYLKLSNGATGNTASDGFDLIMGTSSDVYLYNRENGPMIFGTNNTERARITATGEFLVGTTTNPIGSTAVFSHSGAGIGVGIGDIATPANRTGISFRSTTENRIAYDASGYLTFVNGSTERARFTGGQFLVGTTTTSGGEVARFQGSTNCSVGIIAQTTGASYLNFGNTSDANVGFIGYDHTNNFMNFRTNGSERARITSDGNLLVGTTTNVSGLTGVISDVSGNVRAIPQSGSDKTTSYTLVKSDVGKFIGVGSGGSITVPDATFATGDVVSIFNNTSGNVTLTMSITTAYIGGTDSDKATITLATRGIATILFISGTVCVVNGNVS